MSRREELHEILCGILGSRNVYFQPPASVHMQYPAIVYSLNGIDDTFANNAAYLRDVAYEVTVIDKSPDSQFVDAMLKLTHCKFNRSYPANNLNHFVFLLHF